MKHCIMTVDVEGHKGSDPVSHLIYGITPDGKKCGIDRIMDICDVYGMKALFFVDIAEAWDYGEEKIAGVLRHIKERNHDVGVHIHPDHMTDPKRLFLWEYSKEEQREIIRKCTDFYTAVLGEKPKAFRAGKYGANADTLDILAECGYQADFSEFYGQKWCGINPPCTKVRPVVLKNGIKEYPVSAYRSFSCKWYSRNDKIDTGMPFGEFCLATEAILKETDLLVLFAHSFSFLNWRREPNEPRLVESKCTYMEREFEYILKNRKVKNVSLDELLALNLAKEDTGSLPATTGFRPFLYFCKRAWNVLMMRINVKLQRV